MVTINQLLNEIKTILKNGGIEDYIFESRCIIENIMHLSHSEIVLNRDLTVSDDQYTKAHHFAEVRITGYPLQYILGIWEFYSLPFYVGEGVLIPRQDTETLVDHVLNYCKTTKSNCKLNCVDLCSGSGCIAVSLSLNLPLARFSAVEYSEKAISYLQRNVSLNKVENINILKGDVLDKNSASCFSDLDIIVSNPPYLTDNDMNKLQTEVTYEPREALEGGSDGLIFYRTIVANWKHTLKYNGLIAFEIGIGQENDVAKILKENEFANISFSKDLNGIIRVVSANYQPCLNY